MVNTSPPNGWRPRTSNSKNRDGRQKKNDAYDAILQVAKQSRFHPIEQYFRRIAQDKSIKPVDLSTFARDYFGVSGELANEMFCAFLLSLIHI